MSENKSTTSGVGFTSLLLLAFIILKLCKVIDWSWWWVMSPFWIPAGLVVVACIIWAAWFFIWKYPDEKKRAKAGASEIGWKSLKRSKHPLTKSKWQERIEEMQKSKEN